MFGYALLAVLALRVVELIHAGRNTRKLLAAGGREHSPGHYPVIIACHAAWFAAMAYFIAWNKAADPILLGVFGVLVLARLWVLASLGSRWTTRIITMPGAPLVRRGPYCFIRHPNYWIVAGEIAVFPLAFGDWRIALTFTVLNGLVLLWRVRAENRALGEDSDSLVNSEQ